VLAKGTMLKLYCGSDFDFTARSSKADGKVSWRGADPLSKVELLGAVAAECRRSGERPQAVRKPPKYYAWAKLTHIG
jgi:hypothetical protein